MSEEIKKETKKKTALTEEQVAELLALLEKQKEEKAETKSPEERGREEHEKWLAWVREENRRLEERVEFTPDYDGDKYKGYVHISVNGNKATVLRGATVMVKRKHKMVYDQAHKQEIAANEYENKLAKESAKALKEFNG